MTSLRPYLVRAVYDWIVDNRYTPYVLVDAQVKEAMLPQRFIQDGKIVLNIRPEAVQALSLGNTEIEFDARFGGVPMHVRFPVTAILAIYAKENGKGMIFDKDDDGGIPPPARSRAEKASKPVLKVVK